MKILLIGGTGTISTDISRQLLAAGHQLYLLNRGNHNDKLPRGAHHLPGNSNDEASMEKLLAPHTFDVVANFIAFTQSQVERDYRLFKGKTKQYVFISSASAYQKPPTGHIITESTPLANPYWQYSRDKIACEEALMRHYRQDGFPVTIVRPSHTYSVGNVPLALHGEGGSWPVLQRLLDGKPVLVHGDGTSVWTVTHARDFAVGFIGLLGNPHALGQAVHITSGEVLSWNQMYGILADILGVQPVLVHVASSFLAQAGRTYGFEFEGPLLGDKANCAVFDNTKIKRLVPAYNPTTRYDEGMRESIAYLLAHPELQVRDEPFESFCDDVAAAMQKALRNFQN